MVITKFSYKQHFLAKNFQVKVVKDVQSGTGVSWWVLELFYRATVEASEKPGKATAPHFFVWRDMMLERES